MVIFVRNVLFVKRKYLFNYPHCYINFIEGKKNQLCHAKRSKIQNEKFLKPFDRYVFAKTLRFQIECVLPK